jgi:hypothetical protein
VGKGWGFVIQEGKAAAPAMGTTPSLSGYGFLTPTPPAAAGSEKVFDPIIDGGTNNADGQKIAQLANGTTLAGHSNVRSYFEDPDLIQISISYQPVENLGQAVNAFVKSDTKESAVLFCNVICPIDS